MGRRCWQINLSVASILKSFKTISEKMGSFLLVLLITLFVLILSFIKVLLFPNMKMMYHQFPCPWFFGNVDTGNCPPSKYLFLPRAFQTCLPAFLLSPLPSYIKCIFLRRTCDDFFPSLSQFMHFFVFLSLQSLFLCAALPHDQQISFSLHDLVLWYTEPHFLQGVTTAVGQMGQLLNRLKILDSVARNLSSPFVALIKIHLVTFSLSFSLQDRFLSAKRVIKSVTFSSVHPTKPFMFLVYIW